MTPGGTSNRQMKRVLDGMKDDELIPLPRLAERLQMSDSNLRRVLADMKDLGLVIQQPIPRPLKREYDGPFHKMCSMGWKKTRIIVI